MSLQVKKYARKPFVVDAVQVSCENMAEVAEWCGGKVMTPDIGNPFVKVDVKFPANARQTEAFDADWVLKVRGGFKVYTRQGFENSFTELETGGEMMSETPQEHQDPAEVQKVDTVVETHPAGEQQESEPQQATEVNTTVETSASDNDES